MNELAEAQRLFKSNRFDEAERAGRTLLAGDPDNVDALNIVAMSLLMTGRFADALPVFHRVVDLKPAYFRARANLALLLLHQRDFINAELHARKTIELSPGLASAHVTLGRALAEQGRKDDGSAALRRALDFDPTNIDALYWLGFISEDAQRYDLAADFISRALAIQPEHLPSIYLLAICQFKQGLLDDALATYRRGVSAAPGDAGLHGNLLFAMMYHPTISPRELLDEHMKWNAVHAGDLPTAPAALPARADRALRIGYVSPYFQEHSVAFFLEAILEHHDRNVFKIFLYSDVEYPDAVTARLKKLADEWRDTRSISDESLAELVRKDRIDILVDLTQHTGGSRLLTFARKPAPVQVAYLGYPNTSGLPAIDYRLSDRLLDPIDADESLNAEKTIRLPESYFCYRPPDDAPAISPDPPCACNGHITFVSQNALVKLNEKCIAAWAGVLRAVPDSQLLIKAAGCGSIAARERYSSLFESLDVSRARIQFRNHSPLRTLMAELNDADIALDTFPYNGGTTSCHILWMGVPVISLAGEMPVHRMGLSVLSQIGLESLVAENEERFVEIAAVLAKDMNRLRELRATLRHRMRASPLMDAAKFSRELEATYRRIWQTAVGGDRSPGPHST